MTHCDSGLGGLWKAGVPGRYFSPWRDLMAHCDSGLGGLWEAGVPGRYFSPWMGLMAHCAAVVMWWWAVLMFPRGFGMCYLLFLSEAH